MSIAKSPDKEIVYYFKYLTTKQKKAVLGIVKCFAHMELERRSVKHTRGKAKVLILDELETRVGKAHKAKTKVKR